MSEDREVAILYHANCLDGFGAAYAAWRKFGDVAKYIPAQYGDILEPTEFWNKHVYIVDFSYPAEQLIMLEECAASVVVIDHHKTALPQLELALEQLDAAEASDTEHCFTYIFSNSKSGAVLTWEYFHLNTEVPKLLLHIQDRDLWRFELEGTKEICAALASKAVYPRDFICWDSIDVEAAASKGKILLADFESRCNSLADKAYPCLIKVGYDCDTSIELGKTHEEHNGLAINAPAEFASEVGNILATKSGTYGAVWSYWGGGKYQVSLRSVGDYDVSVIAKYYGGGGHKNAAGFIVDKTKGEKLGSILIDLSFIMKEGY